MKVTWYVAIFVMVTVVGVTGLETVPTDVSNRTCETVTEDGVTISYNLYAPRGVTQLTPVVIIGHGVSANKEMMASYAVELAHQGYVVAALDWRGHGRSTGALNRDRLHFDIEAVALDIPVREPYADLGRIALVGYSMGGFPTYQYAASHPNVEAWVGVGTSADGSISSVTNPKNVLMVIAKYDEAFSPERAKIPMVNLTGVPLKDIQFETLYGSMKEGTARKIHVVKWADHLTTAWDGEFITSATSWIAETFGDPRTNVVFYERVAFLFTGLAGLVGLIFTLSSVLADTLNVRFQGHTVSAAFEGLSLGRFIARYYAVTLLLFPSMIVFSPLLLTPLPFAAFPTILTGGLGLNLFIFCWLQTRKEGISIKRMLRDDVTKNLRMWVFSGVITFVFMIMYYFVVGLHFLGTVPSSPKLMYTVLYVVVLFCSFLFYSFFIQKVSVTFLDSKLRIRNSRIKVVVESLFNFGLIYSWFAIVVLVPCTVIGNYFLAIVLILMVPMFLFMSFFSVYMGRITGSVVPNAVLHAVWLGLMTTTLSPYVFGFGLM